MPSQGPRVRRARLHVPDPVPARRRRPVDDRRVRRGRVLLRSHRCSAGRARDLR
jgi:hypothetical protein